MMSCVTPSIMIAYLRATRSSHPQRRRRPVTAHARAVGLEDAVDLADAVGRHAQTGADARTDRVRGGYEGIRAEIDVEQRTLRTLREDRLAVGQAAVHEILAVHDAEALEVLDGLEPLGLELRDVVAVIQAAEDLLVARLGLRVDRPEVGIEQVAHAHAVAADLVRIGRADTLARGADLGAALGGLVGRVEHAVRRKDQMGLLRYDELPGQIMAAGRQRLGLLAEQDGVQHHAVADDVGLASLEDARRYRTQDVFLTAEFQRMTRIGTALETCYDLIAGSQHVHDLSLALVPPLQAEDYIYFFHRIRLKV